MSKPVYKVVPSPTNDNWMILRDGDETPLVFAATKTEAEKRAKEMAEEHDGQIKVQKTATKTSKAKASKKPAAKKKAA